MKLKAQIPVGDRLFAPAFVAFAAFFVVPLTVAVLLAVVVPLTAVAVTVVAAVAVAALALWPVSIPMLLYFVPSLSRHALVRFRLNVVAHIPVDLRIHVVHVHS